MTTPASPPQYRDYYCMMSLKDFTAWVAAIAAGTADLAHHGISK